MAINKKLSNFCKFSPSQSSISSLQVFVFQFSLPAFPMSTVFLSCLHFPFVTNVFCFNFLFYFIAANKLQHFKLIQNLKKKLFSFSSHRLKFHSKIITNFSSKFNQQNLWMEQHKIKNRKKKSSTILLNIW